MTAGAGNTYAPGSVITSIPAWHIALHIAISAMFMLMRQRRLCLIATCLFTFCRLKMPGKNGRFWADFCPYRRLRGLPAMRLAGRRKWRGWRRRLSKERQTFTFKWQLQ